MTLPLYTRLQLRRDRQIFRVGFIAGRAISFTQKVGLIYAGFVAFALALATMDRLNAIWWTIR